MGDVIDKKWRRKAARFQVRIENDRIWGQVVREEKFAEMLAGQTAIQAFLIEALIESGVLDRKSIVNKMYTLLDGANSHGASAAPIKHLISVVEKL